MARLIECDVCDKRMDIHTPDVAQMSIPASWLGELGDDPLLVDLCSWACVQRINPSAAQPAEAAVEVDMGKVTEQISATANAPAQIGEPEAQVGNVRIHQPSFVPLSEEESSAVTGVKRRR